MEEKKRSNIFSNYQFHSHSYDHCEQIFGVTYIWVSELYLKTVGMCVFREVQGEVSDRGTYRILAEGDGRIPRGDSENLMRFK